MQKGKEQRAGEEYGQGQKERMRGRVRRRRGEMSHRAGREDEGEREKTEEKSCT